LGGKYTRIHPHHPQPKNGNGSFRPFLYLPGSLL
jgi:hypothetical protein